MALVRGIHVIEKGNELEARRVAPDIKQHQRLLVGINTLYGAGAYAWHQNCLPSYRRNAPQVLFEIDHSAINDLFRRDGTPRGFFLIPRDIGSYVTISVVEISNVW